MTVRDGETHVPPAEAIEDFTDLHPRPIGINRFTVLSLASDGFTAYQVDLEAMTCECRDKAFNRDEGEICKHLAAALWKAPDIRDINSDAVRSLANELEGLRLDIDEALVRSAAAKAEQVDGSDGSTADSSTEEADEWQGDPVEAMSSLLRSAGLDPDDFEIWVDGQYGSLQVDQDGYLADDEFSEWVDLSDDIGMGYDGDADVNFLQPDQFPEVFG